ncbi:interleukin-2 receptor subunit beta [Pelobates fuscus]|uniref:interleukin-2 receptor subunit beta n=1 Tax=Pelobates fuscus TaxID=191477 RepID=UPI002FE43669
MSGNRYFPKNYVLIFVFLQTAVLGDLDCTYNGFDVVSCTWKFEKDFGSTPCVLNATHSSISDRRKVKGFCPLPPAEGQRQCNLRMTNALNTKNVITVSDCLNITVNCSNGRGKNSSIASLVNHNLFNHLRLDPPKYLQCNETYDRLWNLSWECPQPPYIAGNMEYQVFYKPSTDSWEEAKMIPIRQNELSVTLRSLHPNTLYEARVRVNQTRYPKGQWSKYSEPHRWKTHPEDSAESSSQNITEIVAPCTAIVVLCILIPLIVRSSDRVKKIFWVGVPDPSRFFDPLISTHKGDFKKWISPFGISAFSPDPTPPDLSPVDINWNKEKCIPKFVPPGLHDIPTDRSGNTFSSFSNKGYFFFQFPNTKEATDSSASFSYGCLDQRSIPSVLQNINLPSPAASEDTPLFHADYLSDPMSVGLGIQNRTFEVSTNAILPSCTVDQEELSKEQVGEAMPDQLYEDVEITSDKEVEEECDTAKQQSSVASAPPTMPDCIHLSFKEGDMTRDYLSLSAVYQTHCCQWV